MRRVIVSNIMSVDGYTAGPGGDVMAMNMDAAFDDYNLERIRAAGTVLLGRSSFEGFSSYWPGIADAPEDPANPALDATNREFSRVYNGLPKAVVTDRALDLGGNPWRDVTTVLKRDEVAGWLAAERDRGEGDILIFASGTLWNDLLAKGEVDELHLMVGPHPLGDGTPVFTGPARLRLLGTRRFDGSDNVLLTYAGR
jgi:dihydrofolate reductase